MKKAFTGFAITLAVLPAVAQNTPLKSLYFQNPYLENPAMAGSDGKASMICNYSSQWNKIEGSPETMSFSAALPLSSKVAAGLNIISDKAGLMLRTQTMVSYAYTILLNGNNSVRLGTSLSWTSAQIDGHDLKNELIADPAIDQYNNLNNNYLDGNFGLAVTTNGLQCQFSYLNLNQKRFGLYSTVDYSTFYSSVSYLVTMNDRITVKPLLAYRGLRGYRNQWDVAAQWCYRDIFNAYTIVHSNKSCTGGLGYQYDSKVFISAMLNSGPADMRKLSGGTFDIVFGFIF